MLFKLTTVAGLALSLALLSVSCKTKPPKQAEVDDVLSDKGSTDMSTGEDPRNGNAKEGAVGGKGEAEMHEKCCGQCKEGLAQDRTGQKPDTIPCADYTAILDPFCLEHFRGKKTMASQCK